MPGKPVLQLEGIAKRFGSFVALRDINLEITEGEFLTVVGPSGSGKSTLIRILVGMDEPTEGKIWLRGKRIDKTPANRRPTCMVFQSLALFPHMSVGQNIEFPLKIKGESATKRGQRVLELLKLLRLPADYIDKRITQCSGGEQQRIALARALAFDPEILFFDEPLSALDYRLRKSLEKELKDLHGRTGKTFVYITHSLEEAMVMSDRIAIMNTGQFEQIAAADEIYARPVSRFVAEFMGEVNLLELEVVGQMDLQVPGVDVNIDGKTEKFGDLLSLREGGTLMIRPEFVRFLRVDEVADFVVLGTLSTEYALGSRIQYEVETDSGIRLTIENLREYRYQGQVGDSVRLGWDIENTHLIGGQQAIDG